ncbi:DUF4230 domain-containing protein [Hyphobacterium sp. CCMP332]|nr:DUF4230 domain-containing protein [Hyphobacterium sp. CCMP332]
MGSRFLIRIFPWLLSILLVGGIYWMLENKMEKDLEEAKLTLKQKNIEELIMNLGKLELMHYKFKDVLFYETLEPYIEKKYSISGDEPIAIVQGIAFAGIDFGKVSSEDFQIGTDSVMTLVVPYPSQFSYTLSDDIRIITKSNIEKELIINAIKEMVKSHDAEAIQPLELEIKEDHILMILEPVLENLTNEDVEIRFVKKD